MFTKFFTSNWMIALGLIFAVLLSFYIVKKILLSKLHIRKKQSYPLFIEIILKTKLFFLATLTLYLSTSLIFKDLTPFISKLTFIAIMIQIGIWANHLLLYFIDSIQIKGENKQNIPISSKNLLKILGQGVIWAIVLLFVLDNLNFDVATLIAGLGIGGIAVALAIQNILSDVLASLSIIVDKPFVVGDFIAVDNYLGTVQYIGIKTSRLQSLSGEQIILSNSDLLKSRLRNYKQMKEKRVVFEILVPFETPYNKLEVIPSLIQDIISFIQETRFERAHLKKIDAYAFNFEVVYYVLSKDYGLFMDIQHKINFQLINTFLEKGIDFAYPTQKKL